MLQRCLFNEQAGLFFDHDVEESSLLSLCSRLRLPKTGNFHIKSILHKFVSVRSSCLFKHVIWPAINWRNTNSKFVSPRAFYLKKVFFLELTVRPIKVLSGEGKDLYSGYAGIENAFDGVFPMTGNSGLCYCSRTPPLEATFKILQSLVQSISLFPITFTG